MVKQRQKNRRKIKLLYFVRSSWYWNSYLDFCQHQSTCFLILCGLKLDFLSSGVRLFQVNLSRFPHFLCLRYLYSANFYQQQRNFVTSMMTGYCLGRMDNAINHSCDCQVTTTAFQPSHICNIWTSMSPCSASPWAALVGLTEHHPYSTIWSSHISYSVNCVQYPKLGPQIENLLLKNKTKTETKNYWSSSIIWGIYGL